MTIAQSLTRIDWFAAADAPNVIDAEPVEQHWGAGRHRLGRPGLVHVWALAGIRPRRRRLHAPKPRLALLPGGAR